MLQEPRDLRADNRAGRKAIKYILVFIIALIIGHLFLTVLGAILNNPGPLPELPGLIDLQKAETYEQAEKILQDAGFRPLQDKQSPLPQTTMRTFLPQAAGIFGHHPLYCMLASVEGSKPSPVMTAYYFSEPAGGTFENPGEVFTAIRDGLNASLKKEPEETVQDGLPVLLWELNKKVAAMLSYAQDGAPVLMYIFAR